MESGKTFIATKVHDKDCEICKQMSRHDRTVFEENPEIAYQEVSLDDLISHNGDPTKHRIYQCLERYALNPDYTLDLPAYVILAKTGKYVGHHIGTATVAELREKIRAIISEDP